VSEGAPAAFVVAGPAGAGKSTLGRALARSTRAVLLDLDTVTNPLLDRLQLGDPAPWSTHWNNPEHRAALRPARYAALLAVARAQADLGHDLVLVAPFTAELAGGPEWDQLLAAVAPGEVRVVWLRLSSDELAARLGARGEPRDAGITAPGPAEPVPPAVPHLAVDATLATAVQVDLVLSAY
jgi:sugar-phosphatase